MRSSSKKILLSQGNQGYGQGVPEGVPFDRLLESYFLWFLAEKSTVIGPLGEGFHSPPGTYLNSTLGFAYLSQRCWGPQIPSRLRIK